MHMGACAMTELGIVHDLDRELQDIRSELVSELESADLQRQRVARLLQRVDLLAHAHKRELAARDARIAELEREVMELRGQLVHP